MTARLSRLSKPFMPPSMAERATNSRYALLEQLSVGGMPIQTDVPELVSDLISLHAAGLIEGDAAFGLERACAGWPDRRSLAFNEAGLLLAATSPRVTSMRTQAAFCLLPAA